MVLLIKYYLIFRAKTNNLKFKTSKKKKKPKIGILSQRLVLMVRYTYKL